MEDIVTLLTILSLELQPLPGEKDEILLTRKDLRGIVDRTLESYKKALLKIKS